MHSDIVVVFKFQTKVWLLLTKQTRQCSKPEFCEVGWANKMHFIQVIWSVAKWTIKIHKINENLYRHLYKNTKTVILHIKN